MALTEETIEDKIEIINQGEFSHIQVRTATVIKRDGVEISRSFHRHVVSPTDDITNESEQVKGLANIVHTANAKAAYGLKLAEQLANGPGAPAPTPPSPE